MNTFYQKRYQRFIDAIVKLGNREILGYSEIHHIQPRCLKGTNNEENLVRLTLREHFLAHWLLWKAYPHYLPLASAFLQMNNKNPKVISTKGFQGRITSKTYERLKTDVYMQLADQRRDKVFIRDKNNNVIVMSKSEYANQDTHKFHTTGKIYVWNSDTLQHEYIEVSEYHANKSKYKTRLCPDYPVTRKVLFEYLDLDTGDVLKLSKVDAAALNKQCGRKKYKQLINSKIKCVDSRNVEQQVTIEEYYSRSDLLHVNSNMVPVFDTELGIFASIDRDEYNLNPNRYTTSTKGKVLAVDKQGNRKLVTTSEFQTGNYYGQTKGLRTVYDSEFKMFVQISEEEFKANREKYSGPCKGKVNVIDKLTGERKQILKEMFDKTRYVGLGRKCLLFKCRNRLTNKEKNINIYEWDRVKDSYEIIELEKYTRAVKLKKENLE